MNSDDVKNTAEIIDTLLQFEQDEEKLDDEVRKPMNNFMFTIISLLYIYLTILISLCT